MTRTILVTGASGALGSELVPRLRERGWRVRALVHGRPAVGADEAVAGDVRDEEALAGALNRTDAVIHLAARTHARRTRDYHAVNVIGTRALVTAARRGGVARLVLASTRAIDPRGGAYSASKAEAERAVRESGLDFAIVRLPELYGGRRELGVDALVTRVRRGRPVPLVGRGGYEVCPITLKDAAAALVAAVESPAATGKTYTLAGECMSMRVFVERCAAALGTRPRIVRVPVFGVALASLAATRLPIPLYPDQLARLRAPKPLPSPEAEAELGFRPLRVEDGLAGLYES